MASSSKRSRSRPRVDVERLSLPSADDTILEEADDIDPDTLKTFIFEVSAGRPRGVADATDAATVRIDSARKHASLPRGRTRRPRRQQRAEHGSPLNESPGALAGVEEAPPQAPSLREGIATGSNGDASLPAPQRRRAPRQIIRRARRRVLPAMVAALATVTLATIEPREELEAWFSADLPEELTFSEVDMETAADLADAIGSDVPAELIDPGEAAFGQVEVTSVLDGLATDPGVPAGPGNTGPPGNGAGPFGEMGALFGEGGKGRGKFGSGLGDAPAPQFFGQRIEGRSIVFVLDNSGSMQGGRLETVIAELLRCVDSLDEKQEFYVIFHSDTVYPLFYPDPIDRYIRPTEANKKMLARWLDTVELCLGDSVDEALAAAAMIEPDTVFLLSDGRIQGQRNIRFLLNGQSRNFPIHTFAVGMGSSVAGRRNLEEIAAANGGEFRESEIPEEMRELARQDPRPYHSESPGPIWGPKVQPFRFPSRR
jgi:hypothetical protein